MGINVTKAFLPPQEEYLSWIDQIWQSNHVTNHGPLITKLEQELVNRFKVKHVFVVSNGTIALQIAFRALKWSRTILTTPFSYVATTSSLIWEGCTPQFIDIEANTGSIDTDRFPTNPGKEIQGVLATHVYGNPCDVDKIRAYTDLHNLKVIYDAAHAFDISYKGKSICQYGDIVTMSFHATKLFHTGEGGAIITNDDELAQRISYLRNFGHNGPEAFWGLGINGKNSELHAAMGLAVLPHVESLIEQRGILTALYDAHLDFERLQRLDIRPQTEYNHAYYPIVFRSEESLVKAKHALEEEGIYPRRYFYPSLNKLQYVEYVSCPISEDIASRILCLPLYHDLPAEVVTEIAGIINKTVKL